MSGLILFSVINKKHLLSFSKGSLLAMLAAFLFALANINISQIIIGHDIWSPLFWVSFGCLGTGFVMFASRKKSMPINKRAVVHIIFAGCIAAVSFIFLIMAMSTKSVVLASTLMETHTIILFIGVLIIHIFRPKTLAEKMTKPELLRKIISTSMVISGTIFLF